MTYRFIEHDEIDSTNSEAKRLVLSGDATQSIILAHRQTAGRGRYGRVWQSEAGNLHMSVLMPLETPLSSAAELSFVMGLAVISTLREVCLPGSRVVARDDNLGLLVTPGLTRGQGKQTREAPINISLKWPNDIFIDDNKIGGILLESITHANQTWLIIGVGLNIEHSPANIPNTSSLKEYFINTAVIPEFASQISGTQLNKPREATIKTLNLIMQSFNKYHNMWITYGFANIRTLWLKHAYRLGKQVTIGDANNRISGIFESISESGEIELKLSSGKIYTISTGEMFF